MTKKTAIARKKFASSKSTHYNTMHEVFASATEPLPKFKRDHQLGKMLAGFADLRDCEKPAAESWRVLSDAINMMETFVQHGEAPVEVGGKVVASHWRGCDGLPVEVADRTGLLTDAITAMASVGARANQGGSMQFTPAEAQAVASVLIDYQAVLEFLPARAAIRCHRATEQRMLKLFRQLGNLPDGTYVMAI